MKHRNSHFAVGYWSRLRQGRLAPDQADVDPRALKRLLPSVFLLEAKVDGDFIYRLAGTALCDRYGAELRGTNFLTHWDKDSRSSLNNLLNKALRLRTPLCLTSIGATEDCRMIEIETVLMPITYGGEEPKRFLAVAQVLTDVAPITGKTITFERLVSSSLISEGESRNTDVELPPPPPPALRSHPRAPHLRLVVSQNLPARAETAPKARHADPLHFDAPAALRRFFAFCGLADHVPVGDDEIRRA